MKRYKFSKAAQLFRLSGRSLVTEKLSEYQDEFTGNSKSAQINLGSGKKGGMPWN